MTPEDETDAPTWTIAAEINAQGDVGLRVYHKAVLSEHAAALKETKRRVVLRVNEDSGWMRYVAYACLFMDRTTDALPNPEDIDIYMPAEGEDGVSVDEWQDTFEKVYQGVCSVLAVEAMMEEIGAMDDDDADDAVDDDGSDASMH